MKVLFRTTGNNISLAGYTVKTAFTITYSIMASCSALQFKAALKGILKQIFEKSTLEIKFIAVETSVLAVGL